MSENNSDDRDRVEKLNELHEEVESNPGIKEVMEAFDQSEEYVNMVDEYLDKSTPKQKVVSSNSSR
jgi:predicted RND superfamily exporter protein